MLSIQRAVKPSARREISPTIKRGPVPSEEEVQGDDRARVSAVEGEESPESLNARNAMRITPGRIVKGI